jgi:hypothetical protein
MYIYVYNIYSTYLYMHIYIDWVVYWSFWILSGLWNVFIYTVPYIYAYICISINPICIQYTFTISIYMYVYRLGGMLVALNSQWFMKCPNSGVIHFDYVSTTRYFFYLDAYTHIYIHTSVFKFPKFVYCNWAKEFWMLLFLLFFINMNSGFVHFDYVSTTRFIRRQQETTDIYVNLFKLISSSFSLSGP